MFIAFVARGGPDEFRDNNLVGLTLSSAPIRLNSNTKTIARTLAIARRRNVGPRNRRRTPNKCISMHIK